MESRTDRRVGLVVGWVAAALLALASLAMGVAVVVQGRLDADAAFNLVLAVVYAALGLLILARRPGNRLAWLFYVVATWVVLNGASIVIAGDPSIPLGTVDVWGVVNIAWHNAGYFVGFIFPLCLFFYLFPTGRFLTRRWSWAGWTVVLLGPLVLLVEVFQNDIGFDGETWKVANPIGFLDSGFDEGVVGAFFGSGLVAVALGGIPAIIVRYRRSETEVRTQIKWVVYALLIVAASLVLSSIPGMPEWTGTVLFVVMLTTVPISVTFAIVRYKLFEIDRIISRTLTYAVVVGLLGALFFAMVTLITSVLPTQNALAVAGSTLAVAALFNPLRRRIQHALDRRFNRSAYRADAISERLANKLQEALTVEGVAEALSDTVHTALQPDAAGIWIKSRSK